VEQFATRIANLADFKKFVAELRARDRETDEDMREIRIWIAAYLQRRCACECSQCHTERNKLARMFDALPLDPPAAFGRSRSMDARLKSQGKPLDPPAARKSVLETATLHEKQVACTDLSDLPPAEDKVCPKCEGKKTIFTGPFTGYANLETCPDCRGTSKVVENKGQNEFPKTNPSK
jgi:hypothetical protein